MTETWNKVPTSNHDAFRFAQKAFEGGDYDIAATMLKRTLGAPRADLGEMIELVVQLAHKSPSHAIPAEEVVRALLRYGPYQAADAAEQLHKGKLTDIAIAVLSQLLEVSSGAGREHAKAVAKRVGVAR